MLIESASALSIARLAAAMYGLQLGMVIIMGSCANQDS